MPSERWGDVRRLFFELVNLEPEMRAARLAELSRTDPALHEPLRRLLQASDRSDELLGPFETVLSNPPVPVRTAHQASSAPDPCQLIGRVLSHYRVLDVLGAGGMGVLYRAVDTRLGRAVALKFLPPQLVLHQAFKRRFRREARAVAALDHPNICAIHEIGETKDGQLFIAMPFYRGETVREKIARGPLGLNEALDLARQAAQGLAAAHASGLVHRDIKPANLIVTEGGRLKILDFGVVKTDETALTDVRLRLGTVAYMSPEQSRGDAVDARTDLWSLGVVLYEMLTGQRPFRGGNDRAVLDAIRHDEPEPPSRLREDLPPEVDRLVLQLLGKDREGRVQGAAKLAAQPARLALGHGRARGARLRKRRIAVGTLVVFLLVGAAVLGISRATSHAARSEPSGEEGMPNRVSRASAIQIGAVDEGMAVRRASILLPDSAALAFIAAGQWGVGRRALAIAPDGSRLVYVAKRGETTQLFLRQLDRVEFLPLPGTEGGQQPFFSPDGEWVGFFAERSLKKVAVRSGEVVTLARVLEPVGGAWGRDGQILVAEKQGFRLSWVPSVGGKPRPTPWQPGDRVLYPELLPPRERWILHGALDRSLSITSLETGRRYALTRSAAVPRDSAGLADRIYGRNPQYLESGHIAYISGDGVLMAFPFDLERFRSLGSPVPIVGGIRLEAAGGGAQLTVSRGGTFIYAPGANVRRSRFVWVDHASGAIDTLPLPADSYGAFDLSPRGDRVLVVVEPPSAPAELWVLDARSGDGTRIGSEGILGPHPRWWPDGRHVVYSEFGPGGDRASGATVRQSLESRRARDTLLRSTALVQPAPDGRHFVVNEGSSLMLRSARELDPERRPGPGNLWFYDFSPDGRWLAFTDIQTGGQSEVYVAPADRLEERHRVTPNGGEEAVWTPDGEALVYRNGQRWLRIDVLEDGGVEIGEPTLLFEGPYLNVPGWSHDISADGHRQLLLLGPQESTTNELAIVINWLAEVERATSAATDGHIQTR